MITQGRRVTVFGGSGFIGRYVVRRLAAEGWVVRVAVRDAVAAAFLKTAGNVGQVVPMHVDITAEDAVIDAAIEGADAVIYLVGILYESGRRTFQAVHADAPARIARIAAKAGVSSFVQMSALGADPNSPSLYARSKAAGEAGVLAAFPQATIIRPSIVFGPEDSFFNRFACMARYSPGLPLIGGGQNKFQPVYVCDVADAMIRTLHEDAARGQIYELGGPRIYTFQQLMEILLRELRRHRGLIPIPYWMADIQAGVLQLLPFPLLTRDQVALLKIDNVLSGTKPGLPELGIQPTALELILLTYLDIYRRGGRFAAPSAA
jgi:NADH dehydrogenase